MVLSNERCSTRIWLGIAGVSLLGFTSGLRIRSWSLLLPLLVLSGGWVLLMLLTGTRGFRSAVGLSAFRVVGFHGVLCLIGSAFLVLRILVLVLWSSSAIRYPGLGCKCRTAMVVGFSRGLVFVVSFFFRFCV